MITALRLQSLVVSNNVTHDNAIQPWRDVIGGKREIISDGNEIAWRESLITVCDALITRAQANLDRLKNDNLVERSGSDAWMQENIQILWREELLVAENVKQCTLRGDNF